MEKNKFIKCPSCKEKSFVNIKNIFDGFRVKSKIKVCALCGYEFKEDEQIEYLEEKRFCMDCSYYAVHPWTQKCTLTNKEVTALDSCAKFKKKE